MNRSDFSLPDNPTEEDIIFLEQYLKAAKKKLSATEYGTKNFFQVHLSFLIRFYSSDRTFDQE